MLKVTREETETWRECVERYGREEGLEKEALEVFDKEISKGEKEGQAAFNALYEWDLLDFVKE